MVILGKKGLSGILKFLLDISFFGGIVLAVGLWIFIVPIHDYYYLADQWNYFSIQFATFMAAGTLGLFIVNDVRRIFRSINDHTPFSRENEKALKRIAYFCFAIAAVFVIKTIFGYSVLSVLFLIVFILAGLFMIVLSEVFREAVDAKIENDLTI
jgi:hypothetical protein